MTDQFYQPAPDDLVACDDGLHYILLDEANAHCNWVMRRHPDGGLVSVRMATEHELAHAKARQHLRAGVARLEVSDGQLPERQETKAGEPDLVAYHCVDQYGQKKVLLPGAEGIRRHILHGSVLKQLTYMDTACRLLAERDTLQQRLAKAEKDAARYRFLRDGERGGLEYWDGEPCVATEEMTHFYDDLDQVIDCAIEGMAERLASPGCADGEQPS